MMGAGKVPSRRLAEHEAGQCSYAWAHWSGKPKPCSHPGTYECEGNLYCGHHAPGVGRDAGKNKRRALRPPRPTIVCLCGSTRFHREFREANLRETLAGKIVLSIGCDLRSDDAVFGRLDADELARTKAALDTLHLRKIELADEVLILNVGGYVGESTARELAHAQALGKSVRFLEVP